MPTKLYDLDSRDYPNRRGDVFRSRQIAECWVCEALTNEVIMGGWPGYGVRMVCPNSHKYWHHELEDKVLWLNNPHPTDYQDALKKEIKIYRNEHKHEIEDDLVGDVDLDNSSLRVNVTNTRSFKPERSR